jgi:hypothetical protein
MKRRIDWRKLTFPDSSGNEPDVALKNFTESVFERLIPHNLKWIERHGEPTDRSHRVFTIGASITDLYAATNGNISLVTEDLIADVYKNIEPDPILYSTLER